VAGAVGSPTADRCRAGIFRVKEFADGDGVRALMAVVSASGAQAAAVLVTDVRDIPEGRGLEELSQA